MSAAAPLPEGDRREPPAAAPPAVPETRLESARREMAFQSLLELGRELTVALDVHETADLLLFNLMGQLGTSRAALWLTPDAGADTTPVLVRTHGFRRMLIEAAGASCAPVLKRRFEHDPAPILSWALSGEIGPQEFELLGAMGIAMFAPLQTRGVPLGWMAVGTRLDGSPYSAEDVEVLRAMLGMVAVSLQNAHLYNRERETTRRLRSANEHLVELDRLKDEFLSNVNHELRTPLAVVIATLDTVAGDGGFDPRFQPLLSASLAQSLKLKGLIENLLSFSEATTDRLAVQLRPGDANALLAEVHRERLPGVSAGLRELRAVPRAGLPMAVFDPQRVAQILNELLDNAIKFTPRGTCIELRSDRFRQDDRDWIGIEVADDGPGLPAERIAALFIAFQQGDGSATRTAGGLGLGLARARALAERMGGRVAMESEPGKGCRVRVLLPPA